jgi:hypothetical protein
MHFVAVLTRNAFKQIIKGRQFYRKKEAHLSYGISNNMPQSYFKHHLSNRKSSA